MAKRSSRQDKIIRNYYENREAIALQRLQELVTDLYLSEGAKRARCWKNIVTHLQKLDVPQQQIDHLVKQDKPELVAGFVKKLLNK